MQFIQTLHKYVKKFVFFSFWCNRRKQGLLSAETILTWRDKRCSLQQSEFHHRLPPATGELKGLNGRSPELNPIEHRWNQQRQTFLVNTRKVCLLQTQSHLLINSTCWLKDERSPPKWLCDQAGDQQKEKVPGCFGCVRLHTPIS